MADEISTEGTATEATATEATPAKAPKKVKPKLYNVGDVIKVPEFGDATVEEVHGRGWVKVSGVPKAWHKFEDLKELNPEAVAKFEAANAAAEQAKAQQGDPKAKKIGLAEAKVAKLEERAAKLATQIQEARAKVEALKNGEEPGDEASDNESGESDSE